MRMSRRRTLIGAAGALTSRGALMPASAHAQSAAAGRGPSAQDSTRRTIERRAVEAVNWGISGANFDLMYQAMVKAGGRYNQVVYWSRLPDWKNQTLTPNPDTIYLMPFISTKDAGPIVIEIPPAGGGSITGTIMDAWQGPLEDVGPAGADQGRGGKYLVLAPGHSGPIPDGYIVLPSTTFQGYALLRSNLAGGTDAEVAKAVAYGKQVRVYPLAEAANPSATVFVDVADAVYDATIPYDLRFFQALDRIVQYEPWLERDRAMTDLLRSIGIEKGKPFSPDVQTRNILTAAASEARAWLEARYQVGFPPFYPGRHWAVPALPELVRFWRTREGYPVDARGLLYSYAYASIKHTGTGQFYLMTFRDRQGSALDGANAYRLTVPANPPVTLYWSATVYDRATHALIRDQTTVSRSSLSPGLQKNGDGSVEIHFAARAPAGKASNWIPTDAKGRFEVLCRFYGPETALLDKTWSLPDIERMTLP